MKKSYFSKALCVVLVLAIVAVCRPMSAVPVSASEIQSKTGDDGTTNWDFIIPVTHQKTVPAGYIGIYSAKDLDNIRKDVVDASIADEYNIQIVEAIIGKYMLMSDIDLSEWGEWIPICGWDSVFSGTFDGNGYVIKNMFCHPHEWGVGLFGKVESVWIDMEPNPDLRPVYTGEIKNIGMVNVKTDVANHSTGSVGAVAGQSFSGRIENCFSSGSISLMCFDRYVYAGGIVGIGGAKNCYSTCYVRSSYVAGGIAGVGENLVENCYNNGDVYGERCAGGIVGLAGGHSCLISNCYNEGNISGPSSYNSVTLGGIVGNLANADSISDCYNLGNVTVLDGPVPGIEMERSIQNLNLAGGIAGHCYYPYGGLSNCYNGGTIFAPPSLNKTYFGALAGGVFSDDGNNFYGPSILSNCFYLNNISDALGFYDKEDTALTNVVALTDAQMKQQSSFVGFDFNSVWGIASDLNNGYPVLLSFHYDRFPAPNLADASAWAHNDINKAYYFDLIPLFLQSKYTQATTRAEFCALAVALYEKVTGKVIADRVGFTDTTDVNVEKMAAVGVVYGTGPGMFSPNSDLTREQAATMLARLANAIGKPFPETAATFGDKDSISDWALEAVGQMQAAGIMKGTSPDKFTPNGSYTREQSVATMLRVFYAAR